MKSVQDLERLVARAALGNAGPRDLVGLKQSIAVVPRVRLLLVPQRVKFELRQCARAFGDIAAAADGVCQRGHCAAPGIVRRKLTRLDDAAADSCPERSEGAAAARAGEVCRAQRFTSELPDLAARDRPP